ncbi:putative Na+/H+ antiporter [Cerasicoccus maritimus]|uniref:putative Na+/H+ antiporter n=1 Tax=Cerasicoccus maritimus TaxID=490089 RepID=UPI002852B444|nr:putative Na+/H+ antiporter [Cerasicoccus maritimus]
MSFAILGLLGTNAALAAGGGHGSAEPSNFPTPLSTYMDQEEAMAQEQGKESLGLVETLKHRAKENPFNVIATVIFLLAVAHTFMCAKFNKMAHHYEHEHQENLKKEGNNYSPGKEPVSFKATLFHFLGEVEAIFGIWVVPLFLAIVLAPAHGWSDAVSYIDSRNYVEPIFVVVIMAIASTRPVVKFAESCLRIFANIGKGTPLAWWLSIMTIAPLLGSFITEPAAMTIAAMLLGQQFYSLKPSKKLCYATLGLLFVNISVGGTLTHFAAPPVLMVAVPWGYDMPFMFTHFGWRAILGILIANSLYFMVFRKELNELKQKVIKQDDDSTEESVPAWVILVHMGFLAWTVVTLHHPPFFVGAFLFFLGFTKATQHHQYELNIKSPMLVGFFLAGLVIHGGLQGWWIAPVLSSMGETALFCMATVLTAFNDNAAITFLASQVPAFNPVDVHHGVAIAKEGAELAYAQSLQYAVLAGAVTGGGLTVIANAPNPAGQSILNKYFDGGISPIGLLWGALIPTLIMSVCFIVIPH